MAARLTAQQTIALLVQLTDLLSRIEEAAVKAAQDHAKVELGYIYQAFVAQQYYNRAGGGRPIEPYGRKWGQIKRRRKWSARRGWATGRLGRAVGNEKTIRPTPTGYRLDLSRSDKVVRRYTQRGNPNSFVASKAPGLMNMKRGWKERHTKAIRQAARPLIAALRKVAAKLGITAREVRMNVQLRLDPVIEAQARHNRYPNSRGRIWQKAGAVQARTADGRFGRKRGTRYRRP